MSDAAEAWALDCWSSMQWGFSGAVFGSQVCSCSLFEEHCRRWCWNCRCWSLVPFVQPLQPHTSSFHVHVHIAPLTQFWVCQGKWGRQGLLVDQVLHSVFPLFFCSVEQPCNRNCWGVCTTVCPVQRSLRASSESGRTRSSADLAAGHFLSPLPPTQAVLPPQVCAARFTQEFRIRPCWVSSGWARKRKHNGRGCSRGRERSASCFHVSGQPCVTSLGAAGGEIRSHQCWLLTPSVLCVSPHKHRLQHYLSLCTAQNSKRKNGTPLAYKPTA